MKKYIIKYNNAGYLITLEKSIYRTWIFIFWVGTRGLYNLLFLQKFKNCLALHSSPSIPTVSITGGLWSNPHRRRQKTGPSTYLTIFYSSYCYCKNTKDLIKIFSLDLIYLYYYHLPDTKVEISCRPIQRPNLCRRKCYPIAIAHQHL